MNGTDWKAVAAALGDDDPTTPAIMQLHDMQKAYRRTGRAEFRANLRAFQDLLTMQQDRLSLMAGNYPCWGEIRAQIDALRFGIQQALHDDAG